MRAEITLKYEEKERLLASAIQESAARSVLNRAEPKPSQPQLVTISCDERAAADILRVAQRHHGNLESNAQADEEAWSAEIDP